MAFREVRDPETGELVIKFDPETDRIQYKNRERKTRVQSLTPHRSAVKEYREVDEERRGALE